MKMKFQDFSLKLALLILAVCALNPVFSQKKSKIKFEADNIEYDENLGKKARRLIGNVVFEHKGALMYCDSAYHYPEKNSLDAFGKVHITQGDSLNLYSDYLYYDGEKELFNCRQHVVLDNKDIHLTTDFLVYDRLKNYGYYLEGGIIVNRKDQSTLTSKRGYYYTISDDFYFKTEVIYIHPDFKIEADTLLYNAKAKKTTFLGPTYIHADSSLIYCENGFFNTYTKLSEYHKNAYIISDHRVISGDSIFYASEQKFGRIKGHASITDTTENISVRGQLAWIYQDRDSAIVTEQAELQQYFEKDTLFLHADTFKVFKNFKDSSRFLKAYWHVRFFKSDMQGKCDSMVYSFADSAIKMFFDPVLWSGENQITGDYIQLNTSKGRMHSMQIDRNAFVVSLVDSTKHNQIRGKDMMGYFKKNKLDYIDVKGNGQTIYYAQDESKKYIGVNRGESSDLKIKLKNNEINEISYINDGTATFFPMGELAPQELRLRGFSWRGNLRPKKRADIFIWKE
jgi:lipopolysaccharide export system protein LptA